MALCQINATTLLLFQYSFMSEKCNILLTMALVAISAQGFQSSALPLPQLQIAGRRIPPLRILPFGAKPTTFYSSCLTPKCHYINDLRPFTRNGSI